QGVTAEGLSIEAAGAAHAGVLATLHRRCFQQKGWMPTEMLALIKAFGAFALIAVEAAEPAGLALARVAAEEGEVLALGVLAERRQRGIGRALLSALAASCAERGAARLFLEVAADNAAAQALYGAEGFTIVGRRDGYYATPDGGAVDGLILAKSLP
ncbi:MAG: GNAT family N-acetyltransferase, partial [Rhodospirillales bacterium]